MLDWFYFTYCTRELETMKANEVSQKSEKSDTDKSHEKDRRTAGFIQIFVMGTCISSFYDFHNFVLVTSFVFISQAGASFCLDASVDGTRLFKLVLVNI